jgi:transposase
MAQRKIYATAAERQKAYRERHKEGHERQEPIKRHPKPPSRPKRLEVLLQEVETLLASYTDWLEAIPESLQDSSQAERLQETIDSLEQVVELLSGIIAPKGFGRD